MFGGWGCWLLRCCHEKCSLKRLFEQMKMRRVVRLWFLPKNDIEETSCSVNGKAHKLGHVLYLMILLGAKCPIKFHNFGTNSYYIHQSIAKKIFIVAQFNRSTRKGIAQILDDVALPKKARGLGGCPIIQQTVPQNCGVWLHLHIWISWIKSSNTWRAASKAKTRGQPESFQLEILNNKGPTWCHP